MYNFKGSLEVLLVENILDLMKKCFQKNFLQTTTRYRENLEIYLVSNFGMFFQTSFSKNFLKTFEDAKFRAIFVNNSFEKFYFSNVYHYVSDF